jgi:hypothetical protein
MKSPSVGRFPFLTRVTDWELFAPPDAPSGIETPYADPDEKAVMFLERVLVFKISQLLGLSYMETVELMALRVTECVRNLSRPRKMQIPVHNTLIFAGFPDMELHAGWVGADLYVYEARKLKSSVIQVEDNAHPN